MGKSTGYKEMLRDRMPDALNFALKWCKAKERWLDLVYNYWIKPLEKDKRSTTVKQLLRIKPKYDKGQVYAALWQCGLKHSEINRIVDDQKLLTNFRMFDFKDTIPWKELDEEQVRQWKIVNSWVVWFRKKGAGLVSACDISHKIGKSRFDIQVEVIQTYLSSLLPIPNDSEEEKERKNAYVDKLSEYLLGYAEHCLKYRL